MILVLEETNRPDGLYTWFLVPLSQHSYQNQSKAFMEKKSYAEDIKSNV